jgi:hypothetical protein
MCCAIFDVIYQVKHTYSYLEGGYGIINEHQLAIGERSVTRPVLGLRACADAEGRGSFVSCP